MKWTGSGILASEFMIRVRSNVGYWMVQLFLRFWLEMFGPLYKIYLVTLFKQSFVFESAIFDEF